MTSRVSLINAIQTKFYYLFQRHKSTIHPFPTPVFAPDQSVSASLQEEEARPLFLLTKHDENFCFLRIAILGFKYTISSTGFIVMVLVLVLVLVSARI